jgi:serine/threonine protein kinase
MAVASTASLVDALRHYRLLEPVQLEEVVRSLQARFPDPKALARELIARGWLTPYQANMLLQGRGQELVLGAFVLLEKLGQGGMGQVYKARNWKLGRVVALKVIRKERLDSPTAVHRFRREVRAVAALSHPNIVLAYDADQVGGTHLLVMEYVQGSDLAKLVKKVGPLPVAQACDLIRQAALGLQHAHERGLVHRDIKPHNLLLTAGGKLLKILDLGLARLDRPAADGDSSSMTQEGAVMGTPDYIAPEQALESHTVDIRADLYSLGCTFYHLLTGRVPFPGGTFLEKITRHQVEDPTPVEQLRPEVPPAVAQVVRTLMAKKPEDRYQTPAEVAAALASATGPGGETSLKPGGAGASVATSGETLDSPFASIETAETAGPVDSPYLRGRKAAQRAWLLFSVAGGSLALACVALLLFLLLRGPAGQKPPPAESRPVVIDAPAGKTPAKVDSAWLKQVASLPAEEQVEAVAAKLKDLNPGFDGKVTHKIDNDVVTELEFVTDNVTDISPVRGLKGHPSQGHCFFLPAIILEVATCSPFL